jgi:hypothetical protein
MEGDQISKYIESDNDPLITEIEEAIATVIE